MMRGKVAVLVAVPIISLVVVGRILDVSSRHEAMASNIEMIATGPADIKRSEDVSTDNERKPQSQSSSQKANAANESAAQSETPVKTPKRFGAEPEMRAPDDASSHQAARVDKSVIGQPFPVSESVVAACKKSPRWCPGMSLLEKMAEEPREEPWASQSEAAIRRLVELEPGSDRPRSVSYTMRNLECRRTICFVEAASHMESFHTQFFYFERNNALKAGYEMDAREIKADGTIVHVTLLPIVRTLRSTAEQ